jgi:hypothetical protein
MSMRLISWRRRARFAAWVLCAVLCCGIVSTPTAKAQDVPPYLVHQGRLLDALNAPVEGAQTLTFDLYAEETGGASLWTETQTVSVNAGFYSVTLGQITPLAVAAFTGDTLYLGVTIGGEQLSPRLSMRSVPYALKSSTAQNAVGDLTPSSVTIGDVVIDASGVTIGGNNVIDGSGQWSGPAPTVSFNDLLDPPTTLSGLGCANGEVAQVVGGAWTCVPASSADTLSGLSCTSGQVAKRIGGAWTCADDIDTDTLYSAGNGLLIDSANTFSVNPSIFQRRVTSSCTGAGQSIKTINADGSVTCETGSAYAAATNGGLTLTGADFSISNAGVTTARLADGSVTSAKVAADAIDSSKILDSSVGVADLSANSVTTVKVTDGAITGPKIATNAITSSNIVDSTILSADLADGAIDSAKILDGAIGSIDIASSAINSTKIADGSIAAIDLADSAVTSAKIADGTITAADLSTSSVATGNIIDGTITAADLSANAVAGTNVVDGSIATIDLADGSVTSAKVADGTIAAADLAASSVATGNIIDGTITAADLASGSITSAKVLDGTLTIADTDGATIQARVSGTCVPGSSIRAIAADGTVTCDVANIIGTSRTNPGRTCKAILTLNPAAADGTYWIDPDGAGPINPHRVLCDMRRDGGGWTLGLKHFYQAQGMYGKTASHGAIEDAFDRRSNSGYKLDDAVIRAIIGASNNFDVLGDQIGHNSTYSQGNHEYVVLRNYTASWTFGALVPESTTPTTMESHRAVDEALAWTGRLDCGSTGGVNTGARGINCLNVNIGPNPQGGLGCMFNMGASSSSTWHHFYMSDYNSDTYLYICNGAQHTSGHDMNHRFWFRERN